MRILLITQFILFGLCFIAGIVILIFCIRNNDKGYDYDKIIRYLNNQKGNNLEMLNIKNKEIDKIEKKILKCKKKLNMMKLTNKE